MVNGNLWNHCNDIVRTTTFLYKLYLKVSIIKKKNQKYRDLVIEYWINYKFYVYVYRISYILSVKWGKFKIFIESQILWMYL